MEEQRSRQLAAAQQESQRQAELQLASKQVSVLIYDELPVSSVLQGSPPAVVCSSLLRGSLEPGDCCSGRAARCGGMWQLADAALSLQSTPQITGVHSAASP